MEKETPFEHDGIMITDRTKSPCGRFDLNEKESLELYGPAKARVVVETYRYFQTHHASPSGQGNWGFVLESEYEIGGVDLEDRTFWYEGDFSDARAAAKEYFEDGSKITVIPQSIKKL